jgi:hypothetical protein
VSGELGEIAQQEILQVRVALFRDYAAGRLRAAAASSGFFHPCNIVLFLRRPSASMAVRRSLLWLPLVPVARAGFCAAAPVSFALQGA